MVLVKPDQHSPDKATSKSTTPSRMQEHIDKLRRQNEELITILSP
jgi:hypothetical protein